MNKFEVGDKVRCVEDDWFPITKGKTYDVTSAKWGIFRTLDDHGQVNWFSEHRFEKVEESPPEEVRVGDIVECIDADGSLHALVKGGYYFVDAVRKGVEGIVLYDVSSLQDGSKGSGWAAHRFKKIAWEEVTTDTKSEETQASELDEFKKRVWEAAQAAKAEHGWCSEIDAVLEQLGVQDPSPRVTYRVMIPVELEGPAGAVCKADMFRLGTNAALAAALRTYAEGDVDDVVVLNSWTVEEVTG